MIKLCLYLECFTSIKFASMAEVYNWADHIKQKNKMNSKLVLQGRPPHAEGGKNIKHSLMRFNLANNVTWPFIWHLPVFSYV